MACLGAGGHDKVVGQAILADGYGGAGSLDDGTKRVGQILPGAPARREVFLFTRKQGDQFDEGPFLGIGSRLLPRLGIGGRSAIGGGTAVNANVETQAEVAGVPARRIR